MDDATTKAKTAIYMIVEILLAPPSRKQPHLPVPAQLFHDEMTSLAALIEVVRFRGEVQRIEVAIIS